MTINLNENRFKHTKTGDPIAQTSNQEKQFACTYSYSQEL